MLMSSAYAGILEGDIKACFDQIEHWSLLGPGGRDRSGDGRTIRLIKAFFVTSWDSIADPLGAPEGN
jgi:hypothetical protein